MDYKNKPNTNLICALSGCYYSPLSSLERILKVGLWDSSPVHLSTVGGQGGEERFALSTLLGSASCSAFRVKTPSWFPLGNIEKTVTVLPSVGDEGCWRGRLSHLLHAGTNLLATKAGGVGVGIAPAAGSALWNPNPVPPTPFSRSAVLSSKL